jgi:hypothetical protein
MFYGQCFGVSVERFDVALLKYTVKIFLGEERTKEDVLK